MSSPSANSSKSPLEAAQNIVAELASLTPEHQSLALKFAMETLGLQLPASVPAAMPSAHAAQSVTPHPVSTEHATDIKSFTALKAPKSDQQFTAVVAYFYQFEAKPAERKEAIDADAMKEAARLAGWPQVQRWAMTLTNSKNAGYLDAAGQGKFKLSSVGENLVAITLPGDGGTTRVRSSNARKKPKKKLANVKVKRKK